MRLEVEGNLIEFGHIFLEGNKFEKMLNLGAYDSSFYFHHLVSKV